MGRKSRRRVFTKVCSVCEEAFEAVNIQALTCGPRCRKEKSRAAAKLLRKLFRPSVTSIGRKGAYRAISKRPGKIRKGV